MVVVGLVQVMGGMLIQVCNVVEIGLEYYFGFICDFVGGLVQILCIECNVFGVIKVVIVVCLVMVGDGFQIVSLDQVMKMMMEIGCDMKVKYKEMVCGGLVVNIVECQQFGVLVM